MEQNVNYIKIMIDSLQKKTTILDKIIAVNEKQAEIIVNIKKNMVEYEASLDEKQLLIDELNLLDDGFQALYNRIQPEIVNNAEAHKDEIKEMQHYIALITDKSVEVQNGEEKNRQVISQQFALFKQEVKSFKANKKVTSQYYNTMQQTNYIQPQFLDKKK
ncbi:flagellin biosynthesis protein FlgN [Konateibacter massiliensis]|uniref:flagellin biosynthesis protein FlgN n=1 Tax=Konateibacter massiliensis TaxID=2002841 RepID=UPI000C15C774|nr:flagellin biosynthesis protein FlgN [Konateibacter massiliensis]